jgi:hypothetical protein
MGPDGAAAIAKGLENNSSLTVLNLMSMSKEGWRRQGSVRSRDRGDGPSGCERGKGTRAEGQEEGARRDPF